MGIAHFAIIICIARHGVAIARLDLFVQAILMLTDTLSSRSTHHIERYHVDSMSDSFLGSLNVSQGALYPFTIDCVAVAAMEL